MDDQAKEEPSRAAGPRRFAQHLTWLILGPGLPLVFFTMVLVGWASLEQRERVLEGMDATTRALQLAVDRELRLTVETLQVVAESSDMDAALRAGPGGPPEGRRPLHDLLQAVVLRRDGGMMSMALVSADGRQIVNSFRSFDEPLPGISGVALPTERAALQPDFNPRALFSEILSSPDPYVSDVLVSSEAGQHFIAVTVPVNRGGRLEGLLIGGLVSESLNSVLKAQQPESGYLVSLVDRFGVVAGRSHEAERFVGRLAPADVRAFLGDERQAARLHTTALDGSDVYASLRRITEAPFTIAYAAPSDVVDAPLWRSLILIGLAGLLSTGSFVALSLAQARRLSAEMALLAQDAQAINERRPPVRQDQIAEVASVRAALREGTSRLLASEERLRLVADGTGMAVWDYNYATDTLIWFGHYLKILGIEEQPDQPLSGAIWRDRVHQEDLDAVQAETEAADREDRMSNVVYRVTRANDGSVRWLESLGRHIRRDGQRRFIGVTFDVTERRAAEERHGLLLREVDHRAKNALAVVQAVVRLTRADDPARYAEIVAGRVQALARAHELLARDEWQGADLRAVAEQELMVHIEDRRVRIAGESLRLTSEAVQPVSMVLHELATNAVKYGALSNAEGSVSLSWHRDREARALRMRWEESGGPHIGAAPERSGFGSRLIQLIVRDQLGGQVSMAWHRSGLVCDIVLGEDRIRLPEPEEVLNERELARATLPLDATGSLADRRVLVVEDEAVVAADLATCLAAEGVEVVGPFPTVELARRRLAETGPIDLAVLDVAVGDGATLALAERLIKDGAPVIFLTGYAELPPEWPLRDSIAAHLRKPVAPAEVLAALRAALQATAAAA